MTETEKDIQGIRIIYGICIVQFVLTLLYVNMYCKPLTQMHVALVGLSAGCGILLSGILRRALKSYQKYSDRKKGFKELEKTLEKIREQKSGK